MVLNADNLDTIVHTFREKNQNTQFTEEPSYKLRPTNNIATTYIVI